jgi:hypothetical protein
MYTMAQQQGTESASEAADQAAEAAEDDVVDAEIVDEGENK